MQLSYGYSAVSPIEAPALEAATTAHVAAGLRELGYYAEPHDVTVMLESHDHFISSATLKDCSQPRPFRKYAPAGMLITSVGDGNKDPEFTVRE